MITFRSEELQISERAGIYKISGNQKKLWEIIVSPEPRKTEQIVHNKRLSKC